MGVKGYSALDFPPTLEHPPPISSKLRILLDPSGSSTTTSDYVKSTTDLKSASQSPDTSPISRSASFRDIREKKPARGVETTRRRSSLLIQTLHPSQQRPPPMPRQTSLQMAWRRVGSIRIKKSADGCASSSASDTDNECGNLPNDDDDKSDANYDDDFDGTDHNDDVNAKSSHSENRWSWFSASTEISSKDGALWKSASTKCVAVSGGGGGGGDGSGGGMWTRALEEEKEKLAKSARRIAEAAAMKREKDAEEEEEENRKLGEEEEKRKEEVGKEEEEAVQVMIVGDSGVGKTSFAIRFADEAFVRDWVSTVGIDFKAKTTLVDGRRVKVHCWDTAGQEKYRTLSAMTFLFRRIDGVVVMFDVASEQSFRNVRGWLQNLEDKCPETTAKLLVANKCDLPENARQVSPFHGSKLAKQLGVSYFECSAADGTCVQDAFHHVVRQVLASRKKNIKDVVDGVDAQNGDGNDQRDESLKTKLSRQKSMLMNAIRKKKNSRTAKAIQNGTEAESGKWRDSNGFVPCPSAQPPSTSPYPVEPWSPRDKYGSVIKLHHTDNGRKDNCC